METRASHLLIGSFVLLMVGAAFGFVIWLAKIEIDREFVRYDIYFEGSVSGLSPAGAVRFKGVPVGTVLDISIDPERPERVRVTVEVNATTPIKQDTVATLEMQGITGVSYVQLAGGSLESPALSRQSGQDRPVIAAKKSQIDELFSGAPELINRFIMLVTEATKVFDDNNRQAMGDILANLQQVTGTVSERSSDIGQMIADLSQTTKSVRSTVESANLLLASLDKDVSALTESADVTLSMVRGTLSSVDNTLRDEATPMLRQITGTAESIGHMSNEVDKLLTDNHEVLTDFFGEGLFEFTRLVSEMRLMVDNLNRVAARLESDPAQFLFGNSQKGFQAK